MARKKVKLWYHLSFEKQGVPIYFCKKFKKTKAFSIPHVVASSRSLFIGNFIVVGTVDAAIEIRGCYFMLFCFRNIYVLLLDFDVIKRMMRSGRMLC